MHLYLQIVTEIFHFAQIPLLDPRMEIASETVVKKSGKSRYDHAHF
jgi:hypothetical protein